MDDALNVITEEPDPGAVIVAGAKTAVIPAGSPLTLRAIAELKVEFPVVVKVAVLELPAETVTEVCAAPKVKVGTGATVIENTTFCTVEPLVADRLAV